MIEFGAELAIVIEFGKRMVAESTAVENDSSSMYFVSMIMWHRHSCLCLIETRRMQAQTGVSVPHKPGFLNVSNSKASQMHFYRRNLPHIEEFNATYFVTFRAKGISYLPPATRSIALKHCLFENGRRIELHACVIMPTHVHLLFTALENERGEPFSLAEIMKGIKELQRAISTNCSREEGNSGKTNPLTASCALENFGTSWSTSLQIP